jgi:hypothetical protein
MLRLAIALAIVALGIAVANTAFAQEVSVGIVGGVNSAEIGFSQEQDFDIKRNVGFNVGGLAALGLDEMFALQLEVLYSQKGLVGQDVGTDADVNISYIELPLLAKVTIPTQVERTTVHLYAGPTIAFEVSCTLSGTLQGVSTKADCDSEEVSIGRKRTDYGLLLGGGLGIEAGRGEITLGVAYDLGLRNVNDDPDDPDLSAKNRTLMFRAGYILPLGSKQ